MCLTFETKWDQAPVDTENPVRIENAGFRFVSEIKSGHQVFARVTL